MFAIIRTGGKQYLVKEGDQIEVETIAAADLKAIEILAIGEGGKIEFGKPALGSAKVEFELVEDFKGPKVISAKFRPKKHSSSRTGHRQPHSRLRVKSLAQ